MTEYETDRLYLATVWGEPNVQVHKSDEVWISLGRVNGVKTHVDGVVTDVRPAVVLDPESYGDALELTQRAGLAPGLVITDYVKRIQTALRSLVKPPIPDEPPVSSIVVDKRGVGWWMEWDQLLYPTLDSEPPLAWGELWDRRGPLRVVYRADEDKS